MLFRLRYIPKKAAFDTLISIKSGLNLLPDIDSLILDVILQLLLHVVHPCVS